MSSPIMPITGPLGPPSTNSPAMRGASDPDRFASELSRSERSQPIEAGRAGPPPELLDEMAAADRIYQRLRESGHELHFTVAEDGDEVKVELLDADGKTVKTLSVAEALAIADGKPVA